MNKYTECEKAVTMTPVVTNVQTLKDGVRVLLKDRLSCVHACMRISDMCQHIYI